MRGEPVGKAAGFYVLYNCTAAELVSLCWEQVSWFSVRERRRCFFCFGVRSCNGDGRA